MSEEQITNIVQSIAQVTGIVNENMVRKAALGVAEFYGIDLAICLERLYFFLADGQETRAVVVQFRKNVDDLDRKAWEADMKDMEQIKREWEDYRREGDETPGTQTLH